MTTFSDDTYQVSIIIVNYNTKDLLYNCLKSIYEHTHNLSYEIIVVDNASTDGTPEMVCREFPEVKFIVSPANLGFGKANNLGSEYSKGEYLFLLNSDTILIHNAIYILYHFMIQNPRAGICGGNLFNQQMAPIHSYYYLPSFLTEFKLVYQKFNITENHNFSGKPKRVDYITGADFMIKKSVFNQAGGFDPDFFMYYEESELTRRVRKMGYQIYSVPEARIIHYQGMSSSKEKKIINTEYMYSKFLYFGKIHGTSAALIVKYIHLSKCTLGLMVYSICRNKNRSIYWKNKYKSINQVYTRYQQSI